MAKLVKFVYVIIVFYTLFLVGTEIVCELFFHPFQISFYFFLAHFSNIILFFFFNTAGHACTSDADCEQSMCEPFCVGGYSFNSMCVIGSCICIGGGGGARFAFKPGQKKFATHL